MSFEAAAAHVSIFPKFASGFGRDLSAQMRGFGDAAGREGGKSAGTGFLGVLKGVLGAQAIMGALGGVKNAISGAFKGGFDRLMNIEQAQIKLRTLGLDVEASMASVSSAVDGTKFAISDAADMAAVLGAAGVDAGEEMTRWLSLTADSAQFLNRPFADVQRNIQKIVAEGRVTGETFQELPVAAAALADYLGISQEEVRKLASQGEISAEQFAAAMESKIGGAAKNAGESFLSLRDNIRTAMNASAAALLEPITKAMMPLMTVGLDLVKQFRDNVAKPLGESLGAFLIPKAEELAGALSQFDFAGIFQRIGDAVAPVLPLLQQWAGNSAALWGGLATALMPVLAQLGPMLEQLAPALSQILGTTGDLIAGIMPIVTDLIAQLLPPIMQLVTTLLPPLAGLFALLVAQVAPLVMQLVEGLAPILVTLVESLVPALIRIFEAVIPVVAQIIEALAPLVEMIIAQLIPVIETLLPVVTTIFEGVAAIIESVMGIISSVISAITSAISGDWDAAWGHMGEAVSKIFTDLIPTILGILGDLGAKLFDAGRAIVQNLIDGIMGMLGGVGDAIGSVVGKIADFLPHSPAKTGPLSGSGWGGWGEAIAGQLASELDQSVSMVARASARMTGAAVPGMAAQSIGAVGAGRAVGQLTQNNTFYGTDTQQVLREAGREFREAMLR